MLKISRIARHTTRLAWGCPQLSEAGCGINYRSR